MCRAPHIQPPLCAAVWAQHNGAHTEHMIWVSRLAHSVSSISASYFWSFCFFGSQDFSSQDKIRTQQHGVNGLVICIQNQKYSLKPVRAYADLVPTTAVLLYNDQKKTILTCIIEMFPRAHRLWCVCTYWRDIRSSVCGES